MKFLGFWFKNDNSDGNISSGKKKKKKTKKNNNNNDKKQKNTNRVKKFFVGIHYAFFWFLVTKHPFS